MVDILGLVSNLGTVTNDSRDTHICYGFYDSTRKVRSIFLTMRLIATQTVVVEKAVEVVVAAVSY